MSTRQITSYGHGRTWRFSIVTDHNGRYFIRRDGEPLGSVMGYGTRSEAVQAIEQTKRWDRIAASA